MVRAVTVMSFAAVLCRPAPLRAQETSTLLPHDADARWSVSGQANFIVQWHDAFPSPYQGENSLRPTAEHATSSLLTLRTRVRLTTHTDVVFDVESAGGRGIGDALGLAGFTDLDVVRNPALGAKPYIARLYVHQAAALADRRRIDIRAGKLSTVDWFDLNGPGSDSRFQFMNWTADNNGAYDYAADTRGYTIGVETEYTDRDWSLRFAEMLMPTVANGIDLDWSIRHAHADNLELELRRGLVPGRDGTIRLLGYVNHANMGSYAEAIDAWRAGRDPRPTIELHRAQGRTKSGIGVNVEQSIGGGVRAFSRWGWNEGRHESFAYTEVNRTMELGADMRGERWSRGSDKLGAVVIANELSDDHRAYLEAGGLGFLLGDGRLTYGAERIVEAYYTAQLWRGVFASVDLQRIVNPGYNEDRGPVLVPGLRLHLEF
jgi:high affinity Mn2+ porin